MENTKKVIERLIKEKTVSNIAIRVAKNNEILGKFKFPYKIDSSTYSVNEEQLLWLLHGLKIEEVEHYMAIKNEKFYVKKSNFRAFLLAFFRKI